MEIYERIRELRKNVLGLSQTDFADRLGTSRSVIKNIEANVLARPEQKLSLYKLICSEFNVSEEWLLNGNGPMFGSNEAEYSTMIDQIMQGENEFAKNVFKTFAMLDASDWEALQHVIDTYLKLSGNIGDSVPDTPEELEALFPPVADENNNAG